MLGAAGISANPAAAGNLSAIVDRQRDGQRPILARALGDHRVEVDHAPPRVEKCARVYRRLTGSGGSAIRNEPDRCTSIVHRKRGAVGGGELRHRSECVRSLIPNAKSRSAGCGGIAMTRSRLVCRESRHRRPAAILPGRRFVRYRSPLERNRTWSNCRTLRWGRAADRRSSESRRSNRSICRR